MEPVKQAMKRELSHLSQHLTELEHKGQGHGPSAEKVRAKVRRILVLQAAWGLVK